MKHSANHAVFSGLPAEATASALADIPNRADNGEANTTEWLSETGADESVQDLNIIPILVVSDTRNKAEMLNGLLRSEGLAVHPQWVASTNDWDKQEFVPELVFYFDDLEEPSLEEVVAASEPLGAAVIAVSTHYDQEAAATAIGFGAASQVCLSDTALLAGIARREHRNRNERSELRTLRRELKQSNQRLRNLMAGSHDAIAYTQDGLITNVNPTWAEHFGYDKPDGLVDAPIMDLFSGKDQGRLKKALRALGRGKSTDDAFECTAIHKDGSEFRAELKLASTEINGEDMVQFILTADTGTVTQNTAVLQQIDELEKEKAQLQEKLGELREHEVDSRLLRPTAFAALAAERVSRPLAGAARALVAFRPAKPQAAVSIFNPLGMAEAGIELSSVLSPLLEEEDIAVHIGQLTILALINRNHAKEIQDWAQKTVDALCEHVLVSSDRSSLLGFVAGIAPVDRVRRLEQLVHQAIKTANGEPGSIGTTTAAEITTVDTDDTGWSALISEALEERRFAVALRPIEDLASARKIYAIDARLLDREGKEIDAETFMPPADRLGFTQRIEQRLIGHALISLLRLLKTNQDTQIIIPLSTSVMQDDTLTGLVLALIKRTSAQLPAKSLIFELSLKDAVSHLIDVVQYTQNLRDLYCGFGIRDYLPAADAEKALDKLPVDSIRIAPDCIARLGEDKEMAKAIEQLMIRYSDRPCRIIASGVNDANLMARLYNIGLSTMEGDAIGEAEIFNSQNPMFEALYAKE